jgi:hypothetical protein
MADGLEEDAEGEEREASGHWGENITGSVGRERGLSNYPEGFISASFRLRSHFR